MDLALNEKVALVTAASEGLGFACALRLAQAGCRIAICARRNDVLQRAQSEITAAAGTEVVAIPVDLMQAEEIQRFVKTAHERFQRIDILVANTGHIPYGGLWELSDAQWYRAFDLLLMSMIRLVRQVVPFMQEQGMGDIVVISSAVVKEPSPHLLLSNVFRVGGVALAKSLSQQLAADNIRVNTVAPGYFDTGRVRKRIDELMAKEDISREAAAHSIAGNIPLGRIGTAGELADFVAFLVSRRAEFLTGATIQIDGGNTHSLL